MICLARFWSLISSMSIRRTDQNRNHTTVHGAPSFRGDCRAGESGAARARSLSHYDAREPGRRSGTARRKHALAGGGQERAAQAYALDLVAPRQSRPRSSSAKAASVVIEQTGHSPSLGAEGILVPSLD